MSANQHTFLLLLLFLAAIAVLSSTGISFIAHRQQKPQLEKKAKVIFWLGFVIMLILLKMIN